MGDTESVRGSHGDDAHPLDRQRRRPPPLARQGEDGIEGKAIREHPCDKANAKRDNCFKPALLICLESRPPIRQRPHRPAA